MLSYSKTLSDCLQACLASIKSVKGDDVKDACIKVTCFIKGPYAGSTCSVEIKYA